MFDGQNSTRRINLSGRTGRAESSLSRDEFVKRKKKERQIREQLRLEFDSALAIQRVWRGKRVVHQMRREMRELFDKRLVDIAKVLGLIPNMPPPVAEKFRNTVVVSLVRQLNFFFNIRHDDGDRERLRNVLQLHQRIRFGDPDTQLRMKWVLTLALRYAMDAVLPFIKDADPALWRPFAQCIPRDAVKTFVCTVNDQSAWVLFFPLDRHAQSEYIAWHVQTPNTNSSWALQAIRSLDLPPPEERPSPAGAQCAMNSLIQPGVAIAPFISWLVWAKKGFPNGVGSEKLEAPEYMRAFVDSGIEHVVTVFFLDAPTKEVSQKVLQTLAYSTPFLTLSLPRIPSRNAEEWAASEQGRLFLLAFCMVFSTMLGVMDDIEFQTWVTPDLLESMQILLRLNFHLLLTEPENKLSLKLSELMRALFDRHLRRPLITGWVRPEFSFTRMSPEQYGHLLQQIPFTVPFQSRVEHLTSLIMSDREHRSESRNTWLHMVRHRVRREFILEDGYALFESLDDTNSLRDVLRIEFIGPDGNPESGIDGGGLFKEFLIHLCRTAFDPTFGLFMETHDKRLVPNPNAKYHHEEYLRLFHFLGKVVAKAIYEMVLLEPQFGHTFLNTVLGKTNSLEDLQHLDPDLARNLTSLKDMDVDDLQLTFSITNSEMGRTEEIDLIPDGRNVPVTNENKIRYIHNVANHRVNVQCGREIQSFVLGLQKAVDLTWLPMFDPVELNVIVSGTNEGFEVADLKKHTVYSGGFVEDSDVVQWIWKLLECEAPEFRSKFLMFCTSCSRTPLLGFKSLYPKFCIHRVPDNDHLPTASTCANLLKLPDYISEQRLREKLTQSVLSLAGFDLS
eukprot:GEMP01006249.1.p1 GENE.GEMP01006249.1~~GEMP01006249.1.p1  ORF type:complete len:844 (+),score=130.15 GEMP01006249.1:29-2560(+)